jgi:hypothetical protein
MLIYGRCSVSETTLYDGQSEPGNVTDPMMLDEDDEDESRRWRMDHKLSRSPKPSVFMHGSISQIRQDVQVFLRSPSTVPVQYFRNLCFFPGTAWLLWKNLPRESGFPLTLSALRPPPASWPRLVSSLLAHSVVEIFKCNLSVAIAQPSA